MSCSPTDLDECKNEDCSGRGNCTDKLLDFECACEAGYFGKRCEHGKYKITQYNTEAVQNNTIQKQYKTTQYDTETLQIPYKTTQYNTETVQNNKIQYRNSTKQHNTVQKQYRNRTKQHNTIHKQ